WVAGASPWMNSAPSSTGISRPGMRRVQQRPPTRSRASRMSTERPARASSSAAARPEAPAPTTITSKDAGSFRFDTGVGRDFAPDPDLLLDLRAELLGRAAGGVDAVVLQLLAGFLELQRLGHFAVDAVHDRARQALRADQAVPEDHLVAGDARLGDRRDIGQRGNALGSADRGRPQLGRLP